MYSPSLKTGLLGFLLSTIACARLLAGPEIEVARHKNCNLFDHNESVEFAIKLKGFPPGSWKGNATITDYLGTERQVPLKSEVPDAKPALLSLDLGKMDPGYYELRIQGAGEGGAAVQSKMMSFGVVRFVQRTAEEARKGGYRFGLKTFSIGAPGVWWRKGEVWNLAEVVDACSILGLQWTRHQFNQGPNPEPGVISTDDLIKKHPMNVVLKVEGFPEHCFDAARYGTLESWKAKHKNKAWNRCTVPLKEPYQKWLREEIARIPPEQNIFEIGNEVWNYMSAEEFAEWCKMSVGVIKEARPAAKVGADPGGSEYGRSFLKAGGMDQMEIVYSHPYSFTPLPEHRIRGFLRNMREILKRRTGKQFDLYITEYGWPIAPNDSRKHSVSEKVQAQRTTRQSLMLYAEDAKTLIPHWMGDREQDPAEREHWFGFFRLNQQPLPVVIAHANCARMIDGGEFVGDLWAGPGIGAMLFKKNNIYTLAVWTAEETKTAQIEVGVPDLALVDLMGKEKAVEADGGKLSLTLNGDVNYLVGVNPSLASKVTKPTEDLNPDLWSKREGSYIVPMAIPPPQVDGDLKDWMSVTPIELRLAPNTPPESSGKAWISWDKGNIYAAIAVAGPSAGNQEVEFSFGVRPDRQVDMGSTTIFDFDFRFKLPASGSPSLQVVNADFDKNLTVEENGGRTGIRWAVRQVEGTRTIEMEIPVKFLIGMTEPREGLKLSGAFAVKDTDRNKPLLVVGDEKARLWPYLILKTAQ